MVDSIKKFSTKADAEVVSTGTRDAIKEELFKIA